LRRMAWFMVTKLEEVAWKERKEGMEENMDGVGWRRGVTTVCARTGVHRWPGRARALSPANMGCAGCKSHFRNFGAHLFVTDVNAKYGRVDGCAIPSLRSRLQRVVCLLCPLAESLLVAMTCRI
jgi:hypothetical protein